MTREVSPALLKARDTISTLLSPLLKRVIEEVLKGNNDGEGDMRFAIDATCQRLGVAITQYEQDLVAKELEAVRSFFGPLQPLADDPLVSDIIITEYSKVEVQEGRRTYSTGISFLNEQSYEAFVEKLVLKAGTTLSNKHPIADGMIGSFARVHAVHKSLCESGPYLTIRLNRFGTVTQKDLIASGSGPKEIFHYLEKVSHAGNTIMVAGEVGTGKTTLLRSLASALPDSDSILVIEDTPEIRLAHPHVRYLNTREANAEGEGRVTPAECIRGGMRMAMNRIIFGEIRDAEAAEAFLDVCASGHSGLSTIHAKSSQDVLSRLELFLGRIQRGASKATLLDQISSALAVVVFCSVCPVTKKRRIYDVKEIGAAADGVVRQRSIFTYDVSTGVPKWNVTGRVSFYREALERGEDPLYLSELPAAFAVVQR